MERLGIALGAGLSPTDTVESVRLAERAGQYSWACGPSWPLLREAIDRF